MREIKFRGLNTSNKWVYGSLVTTTVGIKQKPKQHTKTWIIESSFGNGGWFNVIKRQYVKPETVSQYTGLLDKQGVDIYEGDIINIRKVNYIVIYNSEEGRYELYDNIDDVYKKICSRTDSHLYEIIGNKYENNEKLKK